MKGVARIVVDGRTIVKTGLEKDWNRLVDFIPLDNEPIYYKPDENHDEWRMKMGDGVTPLINLPFARMASIPGFDPDNIVAKRVEHKLTFGAGQVYQYDGSADVTVPVYTGDYEDVPHSDPDVGYQEDNFNDD